MKTLEERIKDLEVKVMFLVIIIFLLVGFFCYYIYITDNNLNTLKSSVDFLFKVYANDVLEGPSIIIDNVINYTNYSCLIENCEVPIT